MPMIFNIYVPSDYKFKNYFLPRIKSPTLKCFEVDKNRRGIQRRNNNHLIVFLDFCFKKPPAEFTHINGGAAGDFFIKAPAEIELFNRMFSWQKEVSVYSLSYHGRMSVIAWEVLVAIGDDEKVLIEDETGKLVAGVEWVREHKAIMGELA